MAEDSLRGTSAAHFSKARAIVARCEEVLIDSCNAELRLAQQFCNLAELQLGRHHVDRARRLIDSAEKAVAVAGKYTKDPVQRRAELAGLSERIAHVLRAIREHS